jgi:phosphate starvation-inducible PhoH-like protein
VKIVARGTEIKVLGEEQRLHVIASLIQSLISEIAKNGPMESEKLIQILGNKNYTTEGIYTDQDVILFGSRGQTVKAKTSGQKALMESTAVNDIVFAVGPAGTGKTYIAVALAVKALKEKRVRKIVLVRPAVEAGESLGFLPGDLKEKIDPYLRPLYDSLEDFILPEKLKSYLEKNIIEIVPLAYMRGRTLNYSFIIMDEAQNATETQMKMFLTRLGMESKIIITGDGTQIDLPKSQKSGLLQAVNILKNVTGIGLVQFNDSDVVRHKLVRKIIQAYEKNENQS